MDQSFNNILFEKTKEILGAAGEDNLVQKLLFTDGSLPEQEKALLRSRYLNDRDGVFAGDNAKKDAFFAALKDWIAPRQKQAKNAGRFNEFVIRVVPSKKDGSYVFSDPGFVRELMGTFVNPFAQEINMTDARAGVSAAPAAGGQKTSESSHAKPMSTAADTASSQTVPSADSAKAPDNTDSISDARKLLQDKGFFVDELREEIDFSGRTVIVGRVRDAFGASMIVRIDAGKEKSIAFHRQDAPREEVSFRTEELRHLGAVGFDADMTKEDVAGSGMAELGGAGAVLRTQDIVLEEKTSESESVLAARTPRAPVAPAPVSGGSDIADEREKFFATRHTGRAGSMPFPEMSKAKEKIPKDQSPKPASAAPPQKPMPPRQMPHPPGAAQRRTAPGKKGAKSGIGKLAAVAAGLGVAGTASGFFFI